MIKLTSILLIISLSIQASEELRVKDLYKEGDYFSILEVSEERNTFSAEDARLIAIALFKLNKFKESARFAKKVVNIYPEMYFLLGQSYFGLNQLKKSFSYFKKSSHLEIKKDISLFYMARIAMETKRNKLAVKLFNQIVDNKTYDLQARQNAQHHKAKILYQAYTKRSIISHNLFKKKIGPVFEKAFSLDPSSEQAEIIKNEIEYFKKVYRSGNLGGSVNFNQQLGNNSNVIFQTVSPLTNFTSDSTYSASALTYQHRFGLPLHFPAEMSVNAGVNYNHHFKNNSLIKRFDQVSGSFGISGKLTPNLNKPDRSWSGSINFSYSAMDNQLRDSLIYDHQSIGASISKNKKRTTLQASGFIFNSFLPSNDFYFIQMLGLFKKSTSKNSHYLLQTNLDGSLYPISKELNTIDFNVHGTLNYRLKNAQFFISSLGIKTIYPYQNKEARGIEILLNGELGYNWSINNWLGITTKYTYSKKQSKDKINFAYDQSIVSIDFNIFNGDFL